MKINKIFKVSLFVLWVAASPLTHAGFFCEKAKGWHWYIDPELIPKKREEEKTAEVSVNVPKTPTEIVKAYQQELERRLHVAWVNPTTKNIKSYQELQKDMMDRSQDFSKVWMQVVYNNPHLDHTLVAPVSHKARHLYLDQEKQQITDTIRSLSEEYGLFFFFTSQCEYCHQFAPIVQRFSKLHGWEVMAISADGGMLQEFPNAVNDNGILQQWKVEVLPALFAVNPNTGHVIPVANGMTSLDEMEMRIMSLAQQKVRS